MSSYPVPHFRRQKDGLSWSGAITGSRIARLGHRYVRDEELRLATGSDLQRVKTMAPGMTHFHRVRSGE